MKASRPLCGMRDFKCPPFIHAVSCLGPTFKNLKWTLKCIENEASFSMTNPIGCTGKLNPYFEAITNTLCIDAHMMIGGNIP